MNPMGRHKPESERRWHEYLYNDQMGIDIYRIVIHRFYTSEKKEIYNMYVHKMK